MNKVIDACEVETAELFPGEPAKAPKKTETDNFLPLIVPDCPGHGFDWNAQDGSIVLNEQPATAVYFNAAGGLIIRQKADWDQEDDSIVIIAPGNINRFIDELTDICGIPSAGKR